MWPTIFGPGWVWGVLVALAFLCLVLGVLGFLLLVVNKPARAPLDPVDAAWHRYEEGDLTPEEFARMRSRSRRT